MRKAGDNVEQKMSALREAYCKKIVEKIERCEDPALLDLIDQILEKSEC